MFWQQESVQVSVIKGSWCRTAVSRTP